MGQGSPSTTAKDRRHHQLSWLRATAPAGGTAIQLLPEAKPEERAQLRIALSTIKAMMTVEQVEQLEHHEGLLRRYSHLIESISSPSGSSISRA